MEVASNIPKEMSEYPVADGWWKKERGRGQEPTCIQQEQRPAEVKWKLLSLSLCDPVDCSLPGSSVHGILQARILEWVAVLFSKGSSQPRGRTQVSHIAGGFFTVWATKEALRGYH